MKTEKVREEETLQRTVSGGWPYSFIHFLLKCVVRTNYVPSTVLSSVYVNWTRTWSWFWRCSQSSISSLLQPLGAQG